jgi:hypothetical protein
MHHTRLAISIALCLVASGFSTAQTMDRDTTPDATAR